MSIKYNKCAAPWCDGSVVPERNTHGLCGKHDEMMRFFVWMMENVKVKSTETEEKKEEINDQEIKA